MLDYPRWVPAAARARIDYAVEQADERFAAALPIDLVVAGPGVLDPLRDDTLMRDTAAVDGLLGVADCIIETLCRVARSAGRSAKELQAVVEDVVGQRIIRVHQRQCSGAHTLDVFTTDIWEAIRTRPSWLDLLATLPTLAAPTDAHHEVSLEPPATDPLLTISQAAKLLNVSADTVIRMGKRGEIEILPRGPRSSRIRQAEIDRLLRCDKYKLPR